MPAPADPDGAGSGSGAGSSAGVVAFLLAAGGVVALGLVLRFLLGGPIGDFLGGVLYTVLLALVLTPALSRVRGRGARRRGVSRRVRPWLGAALAVLISVLVELLQLTDLPARAAALFPPARLVLGESFSPVDLLASLLGGLLAGVIGALCCARKGVGGPT